MLKFIVRVVFRVVDEWNCVRGVDVVEWVVVGDGIGVGGWLGDVGWGWLGSVVCGVESCSWIGFVGLFIWWVGGLVSLCMLLLEMFWC